MIKKILLTFSLIGLTLFGYSYAMFPDARDCTRIGNGYSYCIFELDIPNEFGYAYAGGREGYILNNVLDGQLNFENDQIILQDNNDVSRNLVFGWNNGKLYGITSYQSSNTIYGQGYIKICESTYNSNGFINDCYFNNPELSSKYSIDYNNLDLNANFDKYIYINTDYNGRIDWINENGMFCFADTTNDYSLCFLYYIGNPDYGYNMFSGTNNLISNVQSGIGERYTIFDNSSPFNGGGGGIVNNVNYTCTKEIALKWYEKNGYSSKLCYGGFDNLNLFTGAINDLPFYGSGLDIEEIWFNTAQYRIYGDIGSGMGYDDWFHYWRLVYNSYYRTINEGGVMNNPFSNTPLVLFTYFSAVNQFGRNLKDKDILEYCDLKLYTSDYSAVYSGNYGDRVCSPLVWLEESVNNLNSSGDVDVGVNIGGSGNSGQNFADGQSFIQSFVEFIDSDKFKGTNTGSNGIIPGYIVLVLCALIFFRFIMH